jgi:hypothetical protein
MSPIKKEARRWIDSDLIGVPFTLLAAAVVLVSIIAIYLGPIGGAVFSAPVWGLGLYFLVRRRRQPDRIDDLEMAVPGSRHRILVVANRGLESPNLFDEICRRPSAPGTDVMILAPVEASSPLRILTSDFDAESGRARERVEAALGVLRGRGVRANGHVDEAADPLSAVLDGLREFPANEVVMLPGAEVGWRRAEVLADRVRRDIGLQVTELAPD